jgi:hypothetical protein
MLISARKRDNCAHPGVKVRRFAICLTALCIGLFSSLAPVQADQCRPFRPSRQDIAGFSVPIIVLSADFEEEGTPDLAVISDGIPGGADGMVSILRGNMDAGYPLLSTEPLGRSPESAAIADFNLDQHLDLVVVDFLDRKVTILMGNGTGGFSSNTDSPLASDPVAVAARKFTGDAFPDLIIVTTPLGFPGTVHVFQGDGLGGFSSLTSATVDVDPRSVVVDDFNGDSIQDIAVGNRLSQSINVILGTGNGMLGTPVSIATGASVRSLVATDLNNDMKVDLVAGGDTVASSVVALLGDGLGGFTLQPGVPLGSDIPGISVCDYDLDGNADVVAAKFTTNSISLLRGLGDGSFAPPADLGANSRPSSVHTSDLNKDGLCDTVSANREAGTLSLFLADGFGNVGTPRYGIGATPLAIASADLNGDGKLDLVSANRDSDSASYLVGDGDGGFNLTQTLFTGTNPGSIAIGDMSGDGNLDIAVGNQGLPGATQASPVSLYFGDGFGSFPFQSTETAGTLPLDVLVSDYTGDGIDDLFVANGDSNNLSFFRATGGGAFAARKTLKVGGQPRSLVALDFDDDGFKDVVFSQGGDNNIAFWNGDSSATGFSNSGQTLPGIAINTDDLAVGDLNGDGRDDLAWLNQDQINTPATVSIYLSDGVDWFVKASGSDFAAGIFAESIIMVDLDRLGGPDLVIANRFSDSLGVYLGDGMGGFTYMGGFGAGREPFALAAGDFNRDDRQDIATADFAGDSISVLLNNTFINPGFQSVVPIDHQSFTWTSVPGASTYRVYRGLTEDLYQRTYGLCLTNDAIAGFLDITSPPAGKAFFYMVTPMINGVEGHMGLDSGCLKRVNINPCPL